ncbi:hypothetical protein [Streptomyces sp. NPDC047718]|uniref:hypothetical protein n=1 Tax=Streptomyces sp. NPDC047718 TaxID=3155479 RepID=UPI0033D45675
MRPRWRRGTAPRKGAEGWRSPAGAVPGTGVGVGVGAGAGVGVGVALGVGLGVRE